MRDESLAQFDSPEDFERQWLDQEAQSKAWKRPLETVAKGHCFRPHYPHRGDQKSRSSRVLDD
jgi:hypothetical protein